MADATYSRSWGLVFRCKSCRSGTIPLQRQSSSWCSGELMQRFLMAQTQHSTRSCDGDTISSSTNTCIAPEWRAAVWFSIQLAQAFARAAPACSRAGRLPLRITSTNEKMPLTRFSSSLFTGLFTHTLRSAPAACSCAPSPLRSNLTRASMAGRYRALSESSLAHAFQIALAASSLLKGVPDLSWTMIICSPFRRLTSLMTSVLSIIAFHSAVMAFSCASRSPSFIIRRMTETPPAS
mmetsp:Transcript_62027/g.100360  ORF Transcript_62027/g.100360 Transcript_62027/m.100360 type:complete len:237 (-) Transcript_62027:1538-2248(-)